MNNDNVKPIRPADDESRETVLAYIHDAMEELLIYEAALSKSDCEIARAVGKRLGIAGMHNDLDVARELLEKAD